MSDSLTLLTSDDPPVSLTASRTALVANSKVFADMLSVPAGGKASEPVVVAEAQEALEPFLRLLEGQAPKLSSPQWEVLARLGDKYDSFVVQQAVDARGWKLESKDEEPLHAFTLATITGNKDLLDRSALRAIRAEDRSTLGAGKEWGDRLNAFEARRIAEAWRLAVDLNKAIHVHVSDEYCTHSSSCSALRKDAPAVLGVVLMNLDPSTPTLALAAPFRASGQLGCPRIDFARHCAKAERKWETSAPQFSHFLGQLSDPMQ